MNIYALRAGVFDEASMRTAELFADQAAIVLANAEAFTRAQATATNLGEALTSRAVIDMAKGIIMGQEGCTPDEAFDELRRRSQAQHRKVREIAQELVDAISQSAESKPAGSADP